MTIWKQAIIRSLNGEKRKEELLNSPYWYIKQNGLGSLDSKGIETFSEICEWLEGVDEHPKNILR